MKNFKLRPLLLITTILGLFFSFGAKSSTFELDSFQALTDLIYEYQYEQESVDSLDFRHALEAHEKHSNFTKNYGVFLRNQIIKEVPLTGTQINLIQFSLRNFLKLTALIDLELDKRLEKTEIASMRLEELSFLLYQKISMTERYKYIYSLFFNEGKLRRIIQAQKNYHPYDLNQLDHITDRILSKEQEKKILRLLSFIQAHTQEGSVHRKRLSSTLSYQLYTQKRSLSPIYSKDFYWSDIFSDALTQITRSLSWGYGMSVGEVEWGPGKLYQNQNLIDQLKNDLRPLDLVFEKKKYKLTDYTIPGHWGHVGIWLGTKEQLIEKGLWEHPAIDPFREQIEEGNSIYEVRKWGLNFENLEGFSNLDEIAVARMKSIKDKSFSHMATIYKNLADQMGKSYDFTFNILATDRTTCTEIIYLSYGHINWPSEVILGRRTISPNNMAELIFYQNSPMELIRYIGSDNQGEMIEKDKRDFARTVGFFAHRDGVNQIKFQKKTKSCQRVRRRVGGGIRFHNECETNYMTKKYSLSPAFDLKIEF